MKSIAKIVSWLSLVALMIPVILFLAGGEKKIRLDQVKVIMNICTVIWFATASMWMWNSDSKQA